MSDQIDENQPNTDRTDGAQEPAKLDHWSPVTEAMRAQSDPRFTKRGNPIDPPDKGTPLSRLLAIVATIFFVAFVVLWQNTPDPTKERLFFGTQSVEEVEAPKPDQPAPGNFGQVDLMGRLFLRGVNMFRQHNMMSQIEAQGMDFIPEDRIRIAIISAELENTNSALDRLESLRLELIGFNENDETQERDPLVLKEIEILRKIYTDGPASIDKSDAQQLRDRYGYIGQVALTHGLPDTDQTRKELTNGFGWIMALLVVVVCAVVVGPLVGLGLLVFGIVMFSTGKMKMRARVPTPGGSVYLETYALFVLGFCIMAVTTFLIAHSSMPELASFSLIAQWLLLATIFWPLVRGTRFHEWKQSIGWHTGEGVFKEIGCGIITYIAALPVYILGVIITAVLLFVKEYLRTQANGGVPPEPEPVSNPIFEIIARGDLFMILFLFILATTWAPIVEESIFRGALHRHFRARLHWVPVGIITAILFAFMHDYGPLMVAPLIALGFMFAFMREWRGSIIAPMTAHFMHNFSLMSFMIILVQLIKDPVA